MLYAVILCGGSGTRLWPLSRKLHPKQFLSLTSGRTLLQESVLRAMNSEIPASSIFVVGNEVHRFMIIEQLKDVGVSPEIILLEPCSRNTAPAVTVAALYAQKIASNDENPLLWVLPADHIIQNDEALKHSLDVAMNQAVNGRLITFGIPPSRPETGYGYIKKGLPLGDDVFVVEHFVEKPDKSTAESFVQNDSYYWNSGMFLFSAGKFLKELYAHAPGILEVCQTALACGERDMQFIHIDNNTFIKCPADSIDYAVMEKTKDAAMVPLISPWSDIGSWKALFDLSEKDPQGNKCVGDVVLEDVQESYVHATHRLVTAIGIHNVIVIETPDAVMVASDDQVQEVKRLVNGLVKADREEVFSHRKVYRPWGSYERIFTAHRFQVKRITVNSGAKLSLQKHHHRAEHWVVVSGTALITKGNEQLLLTEDQSTYIPLGEVHRLEIPGKIPLEIIEIQTGGYLGEDDIVRVDDVYGRSK